MSCFCPKWSNCIILTVFLGTPLQLGPHLGNHCQMHYELLDSKLKYQLCSSFTFSQSVSIKREKCDIHAGTKVWK